MTRGIIDFHTHCYPDSLAGKAVETFRSHGLEVAFDATVSGLRQSMGKAGISISLNLPLVNSLENTRSVNLWAAQLNTSPGIRSLGSIHPDDSDPDQTIAWIKSLGFKGIKMHPEFQRFSFSEPRMDNIVKACVKHGLFLLTHAGRDIGFDSPPRSTPVDIAALHRRFPQLILIAAHFGSWGMWDETEQHLLGLPIYLDLSFVTGLVDGHRLLAMIRKHDADKVIFGSDAPWRDQSETLDHVMKLGLSQRELDMILFDNAASLLDL